MNLHYFIIKLSFSESVNKLSKARLEADLFSMSLVSFSTAFIMPWVEGNLLSPEKTKTRSNLIDAVRIYPSVRRPHL